MKIQKWQYWAAIGLIRKGRELQEEFAKIDRLMRSILEIPDDLDFLYDAFHSTEPIEKFFELQKIEVVE